MRVCQLRQYYAYVYGHCSLSFMLYSLSVCCLRRVYFPLPRWQHLLIQHVHNMCVLEYYLMAQLLGCEL